MFVDVYSAVTRPSEVWEDTYVWSLERVMMRHVQVLAIWSIFTFLLFLCTLALNAALATLFFLLTITFALLAAGVTHATADKVAGVLLGSSPATDNIKEFVKKKYW